MTFLSFCSFARAQVECYGEKAVNGDIIQSEPLILKNSDYETREINGYILRVIEAKNGRELAIISNDNKRGQKSLGWTSVLPGRSELHIESVSIRCEQ